jgi:hypothetical protein
MFNLRFLSRSRFGRRGSILLILGVFDMIFGWSISSPTTEQATSAATVWRQHYLPLWVWGGGWIVVGIFLIFQAFLRHDALGYSLAICQKVIWGLVGITSWMFGGVDRGWVSGIVWLVFATMIGIISGWSEPPRRPTSTEEITHDLGPMGTDQ